MRYVAMFIVSAIIVFFGAVFLCSRRDDSHTSSSPPVVPQPIAGFGVDKGRGIVITPEGDMYIRSLPDNDLPRYIGNYWAGKAWSSSPPPLPLSH